MRLAWCRPGVESCDVLQVKRLGQHHPDVATTLAATAGLLKAMGRTADAETVYRLARAPKSWQLCQSAYLQIVAAM